MSIVKCKHSFNDTRYRYNHPDTGEKLLLPLKKGVMCFIHEEQAKLFPENFQIVAEPEAEELDPASDADDAKIDPPVANDPPSDEDKADDGAEKSEEDPPAGPDESDKAEIALKDQILAFKDKGELDEYAKTLSVELDGRKSLKKMKAALIKELKL